MRRYLPVLLLAFFVVVFIVVGTTLLAGYADKQKPESVKAIMLYTTIPVEQAAVLAQEYEKQAKVRVDVVPMAPADLITKVLTEAGNPRADLVLTSRETLVALNKHKLLAPYSSERIDIIPGRFIDPGNHWTGLWYDPIIFAANRDFIKKQTQPPATWADLAKAGNYRLVITDFLAADAYANLLFTLAEVNGEEEVLELLGKLHPRVVQYAKFLATPPRTVGLGEADMGIAVYSETLRYVLDGFPVDILYPQDGTAFLLTGAGLLKGAPHADETRKFIDWLVQDPAQDVLAQNRFYLIPTNPETRAYKNYNVKNIHLFEYEDKLSAEQKAKLLDKWVQTVRLSPQ
ncbi:MAG TPA: extracellular solute-binding protein [Selenomonadales bacterium]|nr:extracellular solute-binding protein [Selenomonadales bacterium]